MKGKIEKYKYIILIVLVLVASFYWFQLRPIQIRKQCAIEACLVGGGIIEGRNFFYCLNRSASINERDYKNCLRKNGLEK